MQLVHKVLKEVKVFREQLVDKVLKVSKVHKVA